MVRLIIIILIVVLIFSFAFEAFKNFWLGSRPAVSSETEEKDAQKEIQRGKTIIKSGEPDWMENSASPKTAVILDTAIISGPKEGEVIEGTNEVVFRFTAEVWPEKFKEETVFETKVEGVERDWSLTYSNQRTLVLPPGPKEYKFLVRSRVGDFFDSSPASLTFRINNSPFFGKAEIYGVSAQTSYGPSFITLSSRAAAGEKIDITGWQIKGRKGTIIIPQGIEIYQPSYGSAIENILMGHYDYVYLIGGSSPLGQNQNFRFNKCMGYLENSQKFYPSSYSYCPQPNRVEQISHLNEYCQEFILNIPSCKVPDYSKDLEILFDLQCRDYIDTNFNYRGCFQNYSKDRDFLENEWYVYTGRDIVSSLHDILYLRDQNGLLIDKYIY